jgi:apolipoprotein D and lipocalin family protein
MKKLIFMFIAMMIFSTSKSQKAMSVVESVDLNRYTGTWYEIARLPNFFERKLKCITATYTIREDGRIKVLNGGHYLTEPGKVSTATGVAWIPDKNSTAKLKVQFFWPFSGDYWILYLDHDYRFVLIGEPSLNYLWILSREKKMDETTYKMLLQKAIENGYDVNTLIRVDQDCV